MGAPSPVASGYSDRKNVPGHGEAGLLRCGALPEELIRAAVDTAPAELSIGTLVAAFFNAQVRNHAWRCKCRSEKS
jgi:hypothetical protein